MWSTLSRVGVVYTESCDCVGGSTLSHVTVCGCGLHGVVCGCGLH